MWWRAAVVIVATALSGCSAMVTPDAVEGRPAPFGECPAPYAFVGETTLAELGLSEMFGPPDSNRRGTVWITRDAVSQDVFAPPGAPVGQGPEGQALCVEWPDGSGMSTTLSEPWRPAAADAGPAVGDGGVPVGLIGLIVAVLVVLVVSWLSFRRDPRPAR